MRFPYVNCPTIQTAALRGVATVRRRPLVCVLVGLTTPQRAIDCLMDTGADDTILPLRVAQALGLDLTQAQEGFAQSPAGATLRYQYARVRLRLTDGIEVATWDAHVGFVNLPLRHGLLGQTGFFDQFKVTFHDGTESEIIRGIAFNGGWHIP